MERQQGSFIGEQVHLLIRTSDQISHGLVDRTDLSEEEREIPFAREWLPFFVTREILGLESGVRNILPLRAQIVSGAREDMDDWLRYELAYDFMPGEITDLRKLAQEIVDGELADNLIDYGEELALNLQRRRSPSLLSRIATRISNMF